MSDIVDVADVKSSSEMDHQEESYKFGNMIEEKETLQKYFEKYIYDKDNVKIVELGVESGNTGLALCKIAKAHAVKYTYYGFDINSPKTIFLENMSFTKTDFNKVEETKNKIPIGIDFMFVDACHCYECSKTIITNYTKFVKLHGYLVFHDTAITLQGDGKHRNGNIPGYFGILKAVNKNLSRDFKLICEETKGHGLKVFERIAVS